MPPVSLTLRQKTSVVPSSESAAYVATATIEASFGVDKSVFVYRTSTQTFDHYATVADLQEFSPSLDVALAAGAPFFRQDRLTRSWPTLKLMQDDVATTRSRLASLVRELSRTQGSAVIDETVEIKAG